MSILTIVLACVAAGTLVCAWMFVRALKRIVPPGFTMREFAAKTTECGYLAPPPNEHAQRLWRRLCNTLAWIQLGKVKVEGRENLQTPGPAVIAPNHGSSADPLLWPQVSNEPFRYMAARGVFTSFGNWGGLLAGACGGFCADLDKGKGGPAREAAVRVLVTGQKLVMFPEGWAWLDGGVRPFKKGAVRIVKQAAAELGKPTYLIPVYIRYGRYPGQWILRFPPPVQYALLFALFLWFRRGATIVIGKPIPSTALTNDDEADTNMLREVVMSLDPKRSARA